MNQLLDETNEVLTPQKTFSKLAFGTAIFSAILVFYYFSQIPSEMKASDIGKPFISPIFAPMMSISCLLGFVFTVISFIKKEPSSIIKWIAALINFVPPLIGILVNIYDFMR
jgi:hypothetical protein